MPDWGPVDGEPWRSGLGGGGGDSQGEGGRHQPEERAGTLEQT